jgi:1-acyl-sn-glycerol-3-phosphate acyltransferase
LPAAESTATTRILTSELTFPTAPTDALLAVWRLSVFAVTVGAIMIVIGLLRAVGVDTAGVRRAYYRFLARVLGLRLVVRGRPSAAQPMLYVCNHISYLDIVAIGAVVKGEFVARGDMADWPFFGLMAKAGRTVFIDRRRTSAGEAKNAVQRRLNEGGALILFPESTSGDGNHILPFRSALFTVAEAEVGGRPVTVQPMSIAYTRINGLPMGVGWRAFLAWYGDMTLGPHLWQALKLGSTTIEIEFHPPVTAAELGGRKALAAHCQRLAAHGFARALAGRAAGPALTSRA